jgi:hypothetical protein
MDFISNLGGTPSLKGFCDHCGNITFQTILVFEVSTTRGVPVTYSLAKCTICDGVALREHPGDWNEYLKPSLLPLPTGIDFQQLWPPSASFTSDVPARIRTIYDEARLVKKQSPSSFVVQLRRAFEAVVKERQAAGHTLNDQIRWLIDHDQLPKVFGDMMNVARMIGNVGAHDAEKEVTPEDVEISDRFFKAIVEYIYVAPALLDKVKSASQTTKTPSCPEAAPSKSAKGEKA